MALMSVIMVVTTTVLVGVQAQTRDNLARAESVAQARLGLARVDRQVRSGNVLLNPDKEALPMSMRVYTQANGDQRCVQWQVTGSVLRMRAWSLAWETDGNVSPWETVALGIQNTEANPPFKLQETIDMSSPRVVDVTLAVRDPAAGGKDVVVATSVTGRNTIYGYDPGVCSPVPAP